MAYDDDADDGQGKPATKESLSAYVASKNLCEDIDADALKDIGKSVVEWTDSDEDNRTEWKGRYEEYLKLASQVKENKSYPWPGAANVKFPLLTTAAMQFAARAYPALVPGPNLVAGLVIGRDEGGLKQQSAERVGRHMSYQLLYDMPDWEEEMDKLCLILPIAGCLFKKTYYDHFEGRNCSELVLPTDLVIDYYAKTVESAARKAQYVWRTDNEIKERVAKGLFCDLDYGMAQGEEKPTAKNKIDGVQIPQQDRWTPHKFIECHCYWDLDDDGYEEPYVITVHYETQQVARIVARYDVNSIETVVDPKTGKEKLFRIKPIEYFTKFGFIPNPDGSIYDVGFGLLLGGINEAVNTLTNQLLDAGTLSNLQAGFLGRGIRVRGGNSRFQPGEWKPVDFTGDDIKKHIFPLPTKEPSDVLFKLLETLVTSGKELASVAEIFVGKMPGQNTPATTTMATIEQGLKVFTAIYKRIYRALGKEYQKLFYLNALNLPDEKIYFTINEPEGPEGASVEKQDYSIDNISVKPKADPNIVSSAQKVTKVQTIGALLQLGTINPKEYTKRFLEASEIENIKPLMSDDSGQKPYQPSPPPEVQKAQMEMQASQQENQQKGQLAQADAQQKAQLNQQKAQIDAAKAQQDSQSKQLDMAIKAADAKMKETQALLDIMHTKVQGQVDLQMQAREHQLNLAHQQQSHEQELRHAEALAKIKQEMAAKPKPSGE